MSSFAGELTSAVRRCGNAVLVGLDPRFEQLPAMFSRSVAAGDHQAVADSYREFCQGVIDVVAPLVPAVKPQAAFFEECGPAGMRALADVMQYARRRGLLVILDGKRNDIGTTAAAYAAAYLGAESPWQADALTVSPYLGDDSLTPFVEVCRRRRAGIFVLVKTSNPGGKFLQDMVGPDGTVYERIADLVERLTRESIASPDADERTPYGAVGAVVGATYPEQLAALRSRMPHTWLLVPGFGAQGGSAADVAAAFDPQGLGAIINNSRGIIFAHARAEYRDRFAPAAWQDAVAAATVDMIEQLADATPCRQLRSA